MQLIMAKNIYTVHRSGAIGKEWDRQSQSNNQNEKKKSYPLLIIFHQADIQCLSRWYLEQQQFVVLVQSPRCRVTVGRLGDLVTMEASEGMGREGVRYQEKLVIFSNFIGTENNKQIATCE